MAAASEELSFFEGDLVVGVNGGGRRCEMVMAFAVDLSGGVERADAPLLNDAFSKCDAGLEDIV
jgi:hypothetical protein